MPSCLAIQDTQTGLWLIGWDSHNETGIFGNAGDAVCFPTEQQRADVLDILNHGQSNRYVGAVPPPPK